MLDKIDSRDKQCICDVSEQDCDNCYTSTNFMDLSNKVNLSKHNYLATSNTKYNNSKLQALPIDYDFTPNRFANTFNTPGYIRTHHFNQGSDNKFNNTKYLTFLKKPGQIVLLLNSTRK